MHFERVVDGRKEKLSRQMFQYMVLQARKCTALSVFSFIGILSDSPSFVQSSWCQLNGDKSLETPSLASHIYPACRIMWMFVNLINPVAFHDGANENCGAVGWLRQCGLANLDRCSRVGQTRKLVSWFQELSAWLRDTNDANEQPFDCSFVVSCSRFIFVFLCSNSAFGTFWD